jgi:hypothetical protein
VNSYVSFVFPFPAVPSIGYPWHDRTVDGELVHGREVDVVIAGVKSVERRHVH